MKYLSIAAIGFLIGLFSFCFLVPLTQAASLNFGAEKTAVAVSDQFFEEVRVDSEGTAINVAQASISFDKNLVEVVKIDRSDSVFNFWLQEPSYSNDEGVVRFLGGSTNGLNGQSLKVITIIFRAKSIGQANFAFADAAITASDGSGANVLSKTKSAQIDIGEVRQTGVVAPVQISRAPEKVENTPSKPQISVALYPDASRWYNVSGNFLARWNLPSDVSEVAAIIDKNQGTNPTISDGLFDHKEFLSLGDGIWYLHVRFKNNVGWGATAHYRIAIDRTPPKPFEISADPGLITDNPQPVFQFKTTDALSGLSEYQVRIADGDLIKISAAEFRGTYKLPTQPPKKSRVVVKAIDRAGNGAEAVVELEILPIESPKITFVPDKLFSDEERGLNVRGASLPNINILLRAYWQGTLAFSDIAHSDDRRNWEITFDNPLRNGTYKIIAQAQDERGALSLDIESSEIEVKSKPIIQIGFIALGPTGTIFFLILIMAAGFGSGIFFYKKKQEKLLLRVLFSESEISKMFALIRIDLEKIEDAFETPDETDEKFLVNKLKESIDKTEDYLKKGVERIKK
ncbi:hypothetical protein HZC33_00715 [Candidatus Wolfebacteria bacterium]|nr:hypothetical protein [Candidatus Wolfebacteria bacterium]